MVALKNPLKFRGQKSRLEVDSGLEWEEFGPGGLEKTAGGRKGRVLLDETFPKIPLSCKLGEIFGHLAAWSWL